MRNDKRTIPTTLRKMPPGTQGITPATLLMKNVNLCHPNSNSLSPDRFSKGKDNIDDIRNVYRRAM
jgi:hypothetical protein